MMHLGRLEEAAAELRKAVDGAPLDPEAANNLGLVLLRMKDTAGAIEALERAVRVNPNLIKAHSNLAQAYLRAARAEDSRQASRRAAELTGQERALGRAMILVQTAKQKPGDVAGLREAVRLSPQFDEAHFYLGVALGNSEEAAGEFRRTLELNPARADAHYRLGLLLEAKGNGAAAVAEYEEAIRKAPCSPEVRLALGRALAAVGEKARGEAEMAAAKALQN